MQLEKLNIDNLKTLYESHLLYDFPKSELKPLKMLESYMNRNIYEIYALYDMNQFCAYALFMKNDSSSFQLLDYFASNRTNRNNGYGSKMLQMMKEVQPHIIGNLIEVETVRTANNEEEKELRERRISFYLRNGLRKTTIRTTVYGVEFDILYMPIQQDVNDDRLYKELEQIYLQMFGDENFQKQITMEKR